MVNVQKGFKLSDRWKIGVGKLSGFNLAPEIHSRFAYFSYANAVYETINKRWRMNDSLYVGNARVLRSG